MSRILVPVDFSLPCHNAYRFALHLANDMNLDVVLVHYYGGSIDPRTTLYIGGDGTIQGSFEERLRQFAYSSAEGIDYPLVEPPCGVAISYETDVSLRPSAAIIARAAKEDISMVVMATRSTTAVMSKWLGSTSTTVSESCVRPVYLIPGNASCRPFRRMIVANNDATADPYPIRELEELAKRYDAELHFVHIQAPQPDTPLRFTPWQLMNATPSRKCHSGVITVEDTDVSRGLLEYAQDVEADLLIIINHTRSWWRAVLQSSLTQDLALRSRLPVLVLHVTAEDVPYTVSSKYTNLRNA
ncbi:MAG: universal stress protein [Lewinella sp.]